MADINMSPLGGVTENITDRFLVYEGMPGIKKMALRVNTETGNVYKVMEFPQIGKSLPAVLAISEIFDQWTTFYASEGDVTGEIMEVRVNVIEYGGQPDPDYFNITGIDDGGNPVYASEDEES